ncbi:MAG: tRNA (adenosine(37)-N6)-threonylcarbamoyltransferase complex dimerization subunit type 1 TsaB [Actinomycetes bacterium]
MTTLLAIDTSTTHVGVAVGGDGELLASRSIAASRRHAELLVPTIAEVLGAAGLVPADLDAVAVGIGPGLFTGLRVGVTTAMTMAHALGRPVVPVPTLEIIAAPHAADGRVVAAVVDAKRREVFAATFTSGPALLRITEDSVGPAGEVAAALAALDREVLVVGDGAAAHPEAFAGLSRVEVAGPDWAAARPEVLVGLGAAALAAGDAVAADTVRPRYLRRSDAELNWEAAGR